MIGAAELPLRWHLLQPVCEKMVGAEPWSYGIRVKPLPGVPRTPIMAGNYFWSSMAR